MNQQTVLNVLKSGTNVFLTGAPGAGKTYVLQQYIDYLKAHSIDYHVTAPTGIAASHLNGMTLHSYAGLGIDPVIDDKFLKALLTSKAQVVARMKRTDVLIIDEISMVSPELLASIDTILKYVRVSQDPFGGVQVIIAGDFFQLPPVQKFTQTGAHGESQANRYAWQSDVWRDAELTVCYMSERYRHDDDAFIKVLDEIRAQSVSEDSMDALRSCYKRELPDDTFTRLYTHNMHVDQINYDQLQKNTNEAFRYPAVTTGAKRDSDLIFKNTLAVPELILKESAKVIFTKNDIAGNYVNGTVGVVIGFSEDRHMPIIRTIDGEWITAAAEEWSREDARGDIVATVRQLPLRLAWAITVHKSQGMTLDAAEMDLSQSFEVGQGYVALSRVKNLKGLRLMGLNERALEVDPAIALYDEHLQTQSDTHEEKISTQTDVQWNELHKEFIVASGGTLEARDLSEIPKKKVKKPGGPSTHVQTLVLVKENKSVEEIAEARELTDKTVISHIEKLAATEDLTEYVQAQVDEATQKKVRDAVSKITKRGENTDFLDSGRIKKRVIFDHLNEKVSYEEISLVLTIAK